MACVIDQVVVFDETGKGSATCPSSFPEEPSDFSVLIDGQNLSYVGIWETMGHEMWAKGGTADDPIFPAVMFFNDLDGCWFIAAESESTPIVGEHQISMCSSDSDDGSCPDVPFSESAPEKYADYFDEDGNFVPKAGSGGDCPFTIATLRIVDGNGEQPSESTPHELGSAAVIYQNMFGVSNIFPFAYADYQVPLYNGSLHLGLEPTHILSISGDIESDDTEFDIFGDATIAVESKNNA